MAVDNDRSALFRPIIPHQHSRVTYAELFFDLVFVFAVTQISHTLLGRFTPLGAVQTTLLLAAFAFGANHCDHDRSRGMGIAFAKIEQALTRGCWILRGRNTAAHAGDSSA